MWLIGSFTNTAQTQQDRGTVGSYAATMISLWWIDKSIPVDETRIQPYSSSATFYNHIHATERYRNPEISIPFSYTHFVPSSLSFQFVSSAGMRSFAWSEQDWMNEIYSHIK